MDLVASCKDKLTYFRIKELKDVLTQLGLSKQGKKQDLVDRILAILSDERGMWAKKNTVGKEKVATLVDDTYRKMQFSGTAELPSKSEAVSDSTNVKLKEETEDSHPIGKIRCLCGSTLPTDSMIKCEDLRCNVWQHIACVLISEKPMEGVLPNPPDIFYCEICRLARADPFWVTIAHPLYPVKLNISNAPSDGSNPSQSIEKTFQLTRADRDLLSKQENDVQAWCMLLNDKVAFRMQWLQYADLQVNGVPVRAINRPGSQLLGANGRDDGPIITHCTRDGINKIFLGGCDARIFCLGIRIVKRRTLQQVLNMIPKEGEGEHFQDALARVRRCVGGGAATENADSDSDIEVVADCIPVNLRCPMSGLRMKVAGRFKDCAHMGCFDLEVFVEMNQRSRKWQCPICLKNYTLDKIVVDPYFNKITSKMQNCAENVTEIEVKPDGSWRAKAEGGDRKGLGELGLWHLPDGSISSSMTVDSKPQVELKPIKQEVSSGNHGGLRIGMRKNQNGFWEFNKPDPMRGMSAGASASARFNENFESQGHNIIPMSSSATGSGRDCDDGSVNQDAGTSHDFSTINGSEYESIPVNIDTVTQGFSDRVMPAPAGDAEVIILSDSEDETHPPLYMGAAYRNTGSEGEADPTLFTGAAFRDTGSGTVGVQFPDAQHGIPDPYCENPSLGGGGGSCLGLYGPNDDDFGINLWSLPAASQGGPAFQLFGSDVDVVDTLHEMQHNPANGVPSINEYTLTEEDTMRPATLVPGPADERDMADGLLDNPLAFSGNDPSLQIFLPTRPSDVSTSKSDLLNQQEVSNGIGNADWISLRLGDGIGMGHGGSADMSGLRIGQQAQPKDLALDPIADSGSLLLGTNSSRSGKTSRERSESPSPFSFPRQRRSVRSRLYLSIDSESG